MDKTNIDYNGILMFLIENHDAKYADPEKDGLSVEEKKIYTTFKEKGRLAISELKKINEICAKLYGLDDKNAGKWLDGSNTKVRNYLWSKLRYKDFAQSPTNISIAIEVEGQQARFRICLEIINDKSDEHY